MFKEEIKENWQSVLNNVRNAAIKSGRDFDSIKIIAVSKTKPVEMLYEAIEAGISVFGENYSQEMQSKYEAFISQNRPQVEWHYIGTLQRNNVKYIAPFVSMIHSIDSVKLAIEIDKRAKECGRVIDCLLQVNTSAENNKSGVEPAEIIKLANEVLLLDNINIKGLMTIGSFTENETITRQEFVTLRNCLQNLNKDLGLNLKELSMGMSNDYELAISEGATMVRVGSAIFGNRVYNY